MKKIAFTFLGIFLVALIWGQSNLLQSGPMVAYSTMKEVKIVVQTKETAKVYIQYWSIDEPDQKFETQHEFTEKQNAYIAHLLADQLEPGIQYEYALFINDEWVIRPYKLSFQSQPIWLWRHDAPDFSFATGSCAYISEEVYDRPGKPYGGDYQIFENIYQQNPDFMLWLGDNVYYREADWNSETGMIYRFTHSRSIPEMQAMLGSMHHYAIWDDHDYGPNNSDRSYHRKKDAERIFKLFFPGLSYIFDEGTTSYFQWADCEFFLMDNRYWRTPNKRKDIEEHDIIGKPQMEWLIDALVNSYAPFKFIVIGGQFLSNVPEHERHFNYAPKERQYLIDKIKELNISGVIFLTGDMHHTELSKMELDEDYAIYDLTVSPLSSGVAGYGAEKNELQVEGTLVKARNFAKIDVFGPRKERSLKMSIYDSNGVELWQKIIRASELRRKKKE